MVFILYHTEEGDTMTKPVDKVLDLLRQHQSTLIEELGVSAFELLTPAETSAIVGLSTDRFPDLLREGWLAAVPGKQIGRAHLYYRWRAEFVKRYRLTRTKPKIGSSPT